MISVTTGTIVIYILMQIEESINRSKLTEDEYRQLEHFAISDLFIIGLFFLFVLTVQFILVKPTFDILTRKSKMTNKNIILVGVIVSLASGLMFGLKFGTMKLGLNDVLESIGFGIFVFAIFYLTNFLTYRKLAT